MHILIVEDDAPTAQALDILCHKTFQKKLKLVKTAPNLTLAGIYLAEYPIDLLFLDVNLGTQNGFELLKTSFADSMHTIVISSDTTNALTSFDFDVLDFMSKPFTAERFQKAVAKLDKVASKRSRFRSKLPIRSGEAIELIEIDQILYLAADGNYTVFYLEDGSEHRSRKTLENVAQDLDEEFLRIHRSYFVRAAKIEKILNESKGKYAVVLKGGIKLPVSRNLYPDLRDALL